MQKQQKNIGERGEDNEERERENKKVLEYDILGIENDRIMTRQDTIEWTMTYRSERVHTISKG